MGQHSRGKIHALRFTTGSMCFHIGQAAAVCSRRSSRPTAYFGQPCDYLFHILSSHTSDKRAYTQLVSRSIIISLLKCLFKFPLPLRLDCHALLERTNPNKPTLFMPLQPRVLCVFACRLAMVIDGNNPCLFFMESCGRRRKKKVGGLQQGLLCMRPLVATHAYT